MTKDAAIVLSEAIEIMQSLPSEMQKDDQIMDSVIESLQSGISKVEARQDALEIAQLKLQEAMTHGFKLVNTEIQGIRHEAEKDRIHSAYAKKEAEQAKSLAEQAWARIHEVATTAAIADTKAEGAKDIAKRSSYFGFDPLAGLTVCAIAFFGFMILTAKVEKAPAPAPAPAQSSQKLDLLTCGVEVDCVPKNPLTPTKNRGGV